MRKSKMLAWKSLLLRGKSKMPRRKWQFRTRKSKILAWKSLFLRRKGKIRARQSSGSLRSEASQGSSTASRRATRVLDKLPRGFVFNYGELALPGFEVQSVLPLFRSRAFLRGRERKASWRDWLQQTTPGRFSTGTQLCRCAHQLLTTLRNRPDSRSKSNETPPRLIVLVTPLRNKLANPAWPLSTPSFPRSTCKRKRMHSS